MVGIFRFYLRPLVIDIPSVVPQVDVVDVRLRRVDGEWVGDSIFP